MSGALTLASIRNGRALPLARVPVLPVEAFRQALLAAVADGGHVSALFLAGGEIYAVATAEAEGLLRVGRTAAPERWEALTPQCPQLHLFEREMAEAGLAVVGHPWFKPVRALPGGPAWRPDAPFREDDGPQPAPTAAVSDRAAGPHPAARFFRVEGEGVHEVAVGPVHAGVIEPGHFRFQCYGEQVFHLEIALGYQHRGVERGLRGGPDKRSVHYAETLAGDTTVGHATAYCQVVEALAGARPSARALALRGIGLELERLANHTGDLGALAGDVGFLPTLSFCGRLRGDFLNLTAEMCGSRFGRGLVRPGGVGFDLDAPRIEAIQRRLADVRRDVAEAVGLLWITPSVQARFENTGRVCTPDAQALGLVGPAARACGLPRDVRQDFPAGIYQLAQIPVSTWHTGDVFSRAHVRWLEVETSGAFVRDQLKALPGGAAREPCGPPQPERLAVSLVEGWRGEICHVAVTDAEGRFAAYKVVDPSFHNWTGLALALRDQAISDFPLCNKSFNLSYCGFDL